MLWAFLQSFKWVFSLFLVDNGHPEVALVRVLLWPSVRRNLDWCLWRGLSPAAPSLTDSWPLPLSASEQVRELHGTGLLIPPDSHVLFPSFPPREIICFHGFPGPSVRWGLSSTAQLLTALRASTLALPLPETTAWLSCPPLAPSAGPADSVTRPVPSRLVLLLKLSPGSRGEPWLFLCLLPHAATSK